MPGALRAGGLIETSGIPASSSGVSGDIDIEAPLSWSTPSTLILLAYDSINVYDAVTLSGSGALILGYDQGSGTGVLNIPMGAGYIRFTGKDFWGDPEGSLTINGNPYTLVNAANIGSIGSTGDYALATDITAPSGFTPIGESFPFNGDFNGLGNRVDSLNISSLFNAYVGLFGQVGSGGTVENVGLTNISINVSDGYGDDYVGGLAGYNAGTISNSYVSGSVTNTDYSSSDDNHSVGGLAGCNTGSISDSYSAASVTNVDNISINGYGTDFVGGFLGWNDDGTVSYSYSTGTVVNTDNSFWGNAYVGGFAGVNWDYNQGSGYYSWGAISNSYSTGSVTNVDNSTSGYDYVGGFEGWNVGTTSDSYSSGSVTNTTASGGQGFDVVGGFVGGNAGSYFGLGSISDSYSAASVTNVDNSLIYNPNAVTGYDTVGGFAGVNNGAISNSYSAGSILDTGSNSATDFVGGFIGGAWDNWSGMSISNSYYDVTTSGLSIACEEYGPCSGATGLTDPQMKQSSSFTGWDFTNTWVQTNGETYPLLRALSVIIDFEGSQLILGPSEIGGWGMISAINNFYNDGGSCANMGSCHNELGPGKSKELMNGIYKHRYEIIKDIIKLLRHSKGSDGADFEFPVEGGG